MPVEIRSLLRSPGETRAFGRHLGTLLAPGDCVAVTGELGAGKTTLAAGVLDGIHPGLRARSPTYVMVEVYGSSPTVVHADLYRVATPEEVSGLGLEDLARDAVMIIEWSDRAGDRLPPDRLDLELRYCGELAREIRVRPRGDRWERLAAEGALDRERWSDAVDSRN
jgi:tRNA threonylcarbamoyladenosine biosynthesis protein TsaE